MEQQYGLFTKMAAIMGEVDRIAKDGKSSQLPYKFAKDSDVFDAIREKLAEHRIAFFSETLDAAQDNITSKNGAAGYHTTLAMRFTLACADTGQTFTCLWRAESDSYDDKGTSKAQTLGQKYFLLKTFVLSTGDPKDDPDSVNEEARARASRQPKQDTTRRYPSPETPVTRAERSTADEPEQRDAAKETPAAAQTAVSDIEVERYARKTFPWTTGLMQKPWGDFITMFPEWNKQFYAKTTELGLDQAAVHQAAGVDHIKDYPKAETALGLWIKIARAALELSAAA